MHLSARPGWWDTRGCFTLIAALLVACSGGGSAPAGSAKPAATAAPAPTTAAAAKPAQASPTAAPAAAAQPPPRATVKTVLQGRPDQAPFELGWARGYFDRQGIDIEPVTTGTGAETLQAVATNQVDVGNSAPTAALFNALNRGIDIRLVADWSKLGGPTDRTLSIIVRQDLADSARSMADLRGRTVALGGAPGSVTDELFATAVANDGANRADINVTYMQLADVVAALAGRSLDAATLTEPLVTQAEFQGIARVLYPGGAVIPGAYLSVVMFSPEFATQNASVATRWMTAYLQGARAYWEAFHEGKDRDDAIAILTERLSVKDPRVWQTASPTTIDLNGRIDVARLRQQAEFFQREGALSGDVPDLTRYVDPQFSEAAVRQIGVR